MRRSLTPTSWDTPAWRVAQMNDKLEFLISLGTDAVASELGRAAD